MNRVTSEFYNEWQGNSSTSNEWILKEFHSEIHFQVLLLEKKKTNLNKWILQQVVDNDWKVVPSEMIKLIHFHFDVSTFAMVQSPGLKIKKT